MYKDKWMIKAPLAGLLKFKNKLKHQKGINIIKNEKKDFISFVKSLKMHIIQKSQIYTEKNQ